MTTLLLATEPLLPATSGVRLRMAHLAEQLAGAVDLEVAALTPPGTPPAPPHPAYRLHAVPHAVRRKVALATSLRRPYMAGKLSSPALAQLVASRRWSTVQAEFPYLAAAVVGSGAPVVLDAHNLEYEVLETMAADERRSLHRARWQWEAAKTRRLERSVAGRVAAVVTTSDADAAGFEALGAAEVVVVPNGVDVDRYRPPQSSSAAPPDGGPVLLYVGHFGYRPNVVAAMELATEVLPRVRRVVADARLELVGGDPPPELRALASPHVTVTGPVADTRPHLAGAAVAVVPLRAGGGTRLKILEAMAAGVPVVSTPLGATGLGAVNRRELLLAETPADLADATLRLLADRACATGLVAHARALVEARYSWQVVARPLIELHLRLARESASTTRVAG